jgi:hypothetical protein
LILPVVAGVLVMAACDDDDPVAPPPPPPAATTDTFTATLASLNGGTATGTATFLVTEDDDEFIAQVQVAGADTSIAHLQHVHFGSSCPDSAAADTNSDGFIDALEGIPAYGLILVPLDGDVSSQAAGATTFPTADATGAYSFGDTVTLSAVLTDLAAADPDPDDETTKLGSATLSLENRTVVVFGVSDTTTLPTTVLSFTGSTAQASLPVACGPID